MLSVFRTSLVMCSLFILGAGGSLAGDPPSCTVPPNGAPGEDTNPQEPESPRWKQVLENYGKGHTYSPTDKFEEPKAYLSRVEKPEELNSVLRCAGEIEQEPAILPFNNSVNRTRGLSGLMGGADMEHAGIPVIFGQDGNVAQQRVPRGAGRQFILGGGTTFGGKGDSGVGDLEETALGSTYKGPDGKPKKFLLKEHGNGDAPDDFYCAVRMDYVAAGGKTKWIGKKVFVHNPKTGKSVICEIKDWGPHGDLNKGSPNANKVIDMSPATSTALLEDGKTADANKTSFENKDGGLLISFAPSEAKVGPVTAANVNDKCPPAVPPQAQQ